MFTKWDKILIIVLIVASAASYPAIRHFFPGGRYVSIEVSGEEIKVVRLGLQKEISVRGINGESIIRFDEFGAKFVESPGCDNKCIGAGYVKDVGDVIRCVENGVTLRVIGSGGGDRVNPDFITR